MGPPHCPRTADSLFFYYYGNDAFDFQALIPNNRSIPSCPDQVPAKYENPSF
jgi:hypothetical protein